MEKSKDLSHIKDNEGQGGDLEGTDISCQTQLFRFDILRTHMVEERNDSYMLFTDLYTHALTHTLSLSLSFTHTHTLTHK